MKTSNVIVLMGGGLDSSYIAFHLSKKDKKTNVLGLHFDYGQISAHFEREAVSKIGEYLEIKTLFKSFSFPIIKDDYEIKGRNLLFILASTQIASKYNCFQIAIGIHKGSPYYDASISFLNDAQKLIDGYFGGAFQIYAPFINLTKPEIWKLALSQKFPVNLTYSCQNGEKFGCGECPSCKDRKVLNAY